MQMANNGLLDLVQLVAHGRQTRQEGQRGGVMAKEKDAAIVRQLGEGGYHVVEMFVAEPVPFLAFVRQGVVLKDWQGDQRGDDANHAVVAEGKLPERLKAELFARAVPTSQPHPAAPPEKAELAQLVVTIIGLEAAGESGAQPAQAVAGALAGARVAHPERDRVAGVIAVGDQVIESAG